MSTRRLHRSNPRPGGITLYLADVDEKNSLIGRKRSMTFRSWSTIHDIKNHILERMSIPIKHQRLFFHGRELKNKHSLQDCGIVRSGETLLFGLRPSPDVERSDLFLETYGPTKVPKSLMRTILQAKRAMHLGLVPSLAMDGSGGTYFMPDGRGKYVACFKPSDEEPFTINNPRGQAYDDRSSTLPGNETLSLRLGIKPGEACVREVAAYVLDTDGFSGIPASTMVECGHSKFSYHDRRPVPKIGSFQTFVPNIGVAEDFACNQFSVDQVHKIAVLDIRLLNCDRNPANLLVRETRSAKLELVPVDHGFVLPDVLEIGWCDWCWLDWPQVKEPLSAETRNYILNSIDPVKDSELAREKFALQEPCLYLMRMAGMLLQQGVIQGLTLHCIASLIVRSDVDCEVASDLELVHQRAHHLALIAMKNRAFRGQSFSCAATAIPRERRHHTVPVGQTPLMGLGELPPPPATHEIAKLDIKIHGGHGVVSSGVNESQAEQESGCASPPGFWACAPSSSMAAAKGDTSLSRSTSFGDDATSDVSSDDPPAKAPAKAENGSMSPLSLAHLVQAQSSVSSTPPSCRSSTLTSSMMSSHVYDADMARDQDRNCEATFNGRGHGTEAKQVPSMPSPTFGPIKDSSQRKEAHVATAVGGDKRGGEVGCLTSPMPLIRVTSCPDLGVLGGDLKGVGDGSRGYGGPWTQTKHLRGTCGHDGNIQANEDYQKHFWHFAEELLKDLVHRAAPRPDR